MIVAELLPDLGRSAEPTHRLRAIHELRRLSRITGNRSSMSAVPGAVCALVALLSDPAAAVREQAAGTICNMCCENDSNKKKLGDEPGAINALVQLLQDPAAAVSATAAAALSNIAHDNKDCQTVAGKHPDAIPSLLLLLGDQADTRGRVAAARALECLSHSRYVKEHVLQDAAAASFLSDALHDTEPAVRACIASVFATCLWLNSHNQTRVCSSPGTIAGLVGLLRDQCSSRARKQAAAAIGNLVYCNEPSQDIMGQQHGAITGLVALLQDQHAAVRAAAASAITNLVSKHVPNQTRIGAMPAAISGMITQLQDSDAGPQAREALRALASGHVGNWFTIRKQAAGMDISMLSYILSF